MEGECMLREAAICGNEEIFRRLVCNGEDANAVIGALLLGAASLNELDVSRAQASAPGRLAILSFLLDDRALSLYTLNATHSSLKGLTPLGMAAYLNRLDFVTVLLEKGDGLVLVDGLDSQRATPIMYAARDGHTEILQYLIRQGARTDSMDCHHHSVLFYAVSAPQCLWACELNLRLQRAQSLLSHSKKRKLKLTLKHDVSQYNTLCYLYQRYSTCPLLTTDLRSRVKRLVTAIISSDLSTVHSVLFPVHDSRSSSSAVTTLVNLPDENGWSPIHYCVTSPRPSAPMLDALYLAGADLNLYTADNTMTPLHALAQFGGAGDGGSFRLYTFIVHLVRDLGARLDAIDLQGETCIHVAARSGRCADVLMAFLECDTDGVAGKIKNSDGQTALEVAKPEFRSVFEQDDGTMRPDSAASMRTIKPSYSSLSVATTRSSNSSDSSSSFGDELMQHEQFPRPITHEKEGLRAALVNPAEAQQLINGLDHISRRLRSSQPQSSNNAYGLPKSKVEVPLDVDVDVEDVLHHAYQDGSELLERFRQLIDAELDDLHAAEDVYAALEPLITRLEHRARVDEEGARREEAPSPSPSSFRRSAATPSLVTSGSSSLYSSTSFTSLADFVALATPVGSPRMSAENLKTPKVDTALGENGGNEAPELDFAGVLAAGSVTRHRQASAQGATFVVGSDIFASYSELNSPLEAGVNIISIPPERAPEVREVATQLQSPGLVRVCHESWLNPYVRRANSDMFKAHLANLLEIEQTLFGAEDSEREHAPSPEYVTDGVEGVSWREGLEALQEEDANFLEIFGGGDEQGSIAEDAFGSENEQNGAEHFLDLIVPSESGEDVEHFPTHEETQGPKGRCKPASPPSALDILEIARHEVSTVEEAMATAHHSIETVQRYISQAERLTSKILQEMEHGAQMTRLALALSDLCTGEITAERSRNRSGTRESMHCTSAPVSSPIAQQMPVFVGSRELPPPLPLPSPPPPSTSRYQEEYDRKASIQSLMSLASPIESPAVTDHDMRALRRLLVRKIPAWLDATAYDVDKASTRVGVIQAVVNNVQRTRL